MNFANNLKLKSLHLIFFGFFLLSIPFQTRKVFLNQYSFYSGNFTEYTTYFVYASDFFLILTIIFWLYFNYILPKSIEQFSVKTKTMFKKSFLKTDIMHYFWLRIAKLDTKQKVWLILFVFLIWIVINLAINKRHFEISLYQTLKLIEFTALVVYLSFILKNKQILNFSLFLIVISGFIQSLIGILQFYNQKSIFNNAVLHKITGESIISPATAGAAKILFEDEKILRAYGTFPHPNIFGGFLIFTIAISIYLLSEHIIINLSNRITNKSFYNTYNKNSQVLYNIFWMSLIYIQFFALILTFSRSAWLSFIIFFLFFILFKLKFKNNVSRETIFKNLRKILSFNLNYSLKINFYLAVFFTSLYVLTAVYFLPLINSRITKNMVNNELYSPNNFALSDRVFYNIVSRETISKYPAFGSGLGTSIFQVDSYLERNTNNFNFHPWQYQPDHNVYFLIASEIGLVGLFLFILFISQIVNLELKALNCNKINHFYKKSTNNVSRETILLTIFLANNINNSSNDKKIVSRETIFLQNKKLNLILLSLFISFMFIGLFDHYLWTLQQGRLIFWLIIGLILTNNHYGIDAK